MITHGSERRADRRRGDPDWLEVAAQQEAAKAQAGGVAMIALFVLVLVILFSSVMPATAAGLVSGAGGQGPCVAAGTRTQ